MPNRARSSAHPPPSRSSNAVSPVTITVSGAVPAVLSRDDGREQSPHRDRPARAVQVRVSAGFPGGVSHFQTAGEAGMDRSTSSFRLLGALSITTLLAGAPLIAQDSTRVRVDITGVSTEIERNVRLVLQLAQEAADGPLTHTRIVHLHRRAETEIETALRPFGYYEPRIAKSLQPGSSEWVALYVIDPGVPVRVRNGNIALDGTG